MNVPQNSLPVLSLGAHEAPMFPLTGASRNHPVPFILLPIGHESAHRQQRDVQCICQLVPISPSFPDHVHSLSRIGPQNASSLFPPYSKQPPKGDNPLIP